METSEPENPEFLRSKKGFGVMNEVKESTEGIFFYEWMEEPKAMPPTFSFLYFLYGVEQAKVWTTPPKNLTNKGD